MNGVQSTVDHKKQELSCGINVFPILHYLEELFGPSRLKDIVEPLGLPLEFLYDKRNWVSYDWYVTLLEKLVEVTRDEEAPYKAPFSMNQQSVFEDLLYATYASIMLGNPRRAFRYAFSKSFYTRFTKIGDFTVLDETKNSMTVEYRLKPEYKQNRWNCLTMSGFLSSSTIPFGLPPAKVEHDTCSMDGAAGCVYKIKWQPKKRLADILSFIVLLVLVGVEIAFFGSIFGVKDIILTVLGYTTVIMFIRNIGNVRRRKIDEVFKFKQNRKLLGSMEKIEKDYSEILNTKKELEEKNKYFMVINEINRLIAEAFHYNLLLHIVTMTLLNKLELDKGIFFQYNFGEEIYNSRFNMLKDDQLRDHDPSINFDKMKVLPGSFHQLFLLGYIYPASLLIERKVKLGDTLFEWLHLTQDTIVYMLPVEIPNAYKGFFLFTSEGKRFASAELIALLFENISNHLKVGFQKISSRIVVENILSSIPAYVVIFNQDNYEVQYINSRFLSFPEIKGRYTKEVIIGSNIFEMLPFEERAKQNIIKGLVSIALEKKMESYETNLGSTVIEYSLFTIPEYTEGEKLIGLILNDITEAHYFQQKILINEKLLGLGRVASGIAHEINNPLYAVLANAEELADDDQISDESRGYAEEIVEHVMNVSDIIKDLSSYSKTLRKEEFDEVDINVVIEESIKLVKYGSNFLEVVVIKNLLNIPVLKARKGEVQQIFINLFNNSIQAMDGKGRLEISSEFVNNAIKISISDTGKGIDSRDLPHIFDLFYTTKGQGEGTGQGLHIVKKILDRYNGTISCESIIDEGTTFFVTFFIE
jgi:signal transduction histidine kinase